jgi:hypothetical protein
MKLKSTNFLILACLCASAYAGDSRTLKLECDKAVVKAEVLTAHRKWWADRPDPNAPVLNIRTHANFAKNVLLPLGAVISHEKVGALTFEDQNGECLVESNGHPADVVLSDLAKATANSRSLSESAKRKSDCDSDNPLYSVDCHGNLKQRAR